MLEKFLDRRKLKAEAALYTLVTAFVLLYAGTAAAQYRAGIGCPAWKIDKMSAATSITQFECLCFNKCEGQGGQVEVAPIPPTSVPLTLYHFYEGNDIDGNDLAVYKNTNLEACTSECKREPACKAFSYDKWNRWCFLKNSNPHEIRVEPNSIVAVISSASPRVSSAPLYIEKYPEAKFDDEPYRTSSNVSFEDCSAECESDKSCEVFTHFKHSRKCNFIRRPGEYFHHLGSERGSFDSGVKRQRPPGN
jgi:PAN domain